MTEIQMLQTVDVIEAARMVLFLTFGHLISEFVCYFDIRPALAPNLMNNRFVILSWLGK